VNNLERVEAALRREAVDRPPYGFWTHLPGIDLDPQRLAEETAAFAARYDLDFVKSMPNGLYCVEDWGCVCSTGTSARRRLRSPNIAAPAAPAVPGRYSAGCSEDTSRGRTKRASRRTSIAR